MLFCVHKLEQDPATGLPDLRDEAAVRGIPMAGRALHSAKVLLGMAKAKPRRPNQPEQPTPSQPEPQPTQSRPPRKPASADPAIEDQVLTAVRQIQSAAGAEADRMRQAIRRAIEVLQEALES